MRDHCFFPPSPSSSWVDVLRRWLVLVFFFVASSSYAGFFPFSSTCQIRIHLFMLQILSSFVVLDWRLPLPLPISYITFRILGPLSSLSAHFPFPRHQIPISSPLFSSLPSNSLVLAWRARRSGLQWLAALLCRVGPAHNPVGHGPLPGSAHNLTNRTLDSHTTCTLIKV